MTHAPTYLFYDLETSVLNPAFDQPLQFAAIRTGAAFQELSREDMELFDFGNLSDDDLQMAS